MTLTLQPTISIPGLLTAKTRDGKLRNAAGIPIQYEYLDSESGRSMNLDIATSDRNGRFTIHLPPSDEKAKLSVPPIDRSSFYDWTVEINDGARADFVMLDDRIQ